ncbi:MULTISPECIES: acyl carrier protein [unclassified Acinetobacter]|uniref:acyl carrier protein n=1 Tax=unclassified Acinetobacter TaxID=196816 RepID=UPI00293511B2|nr:MULTISPECIES: acyl carrier protein [unclassified Acinetobacter]WOE33294.1 acyl carrier protein [Acinetobacter sp. SAAs470]WOE36928.1 acyl carrier protein [Acinetobacter sp. SAAs474]
MNIKNDVITIWKSRTKYSHADMSEDFFDVGGDSLGSIYLLVDINNFFGIELEPDDFFTSPTLGNLINLIEQMLK